MVLVDPEANVVHIQGGRKVAPLSPTMWLLVFYSVHRVHSGYVPCVVYNTTSYWKNVRGYRTTMVIYFSGWFTLL